MDLLTTRRRVFARLGPGPGPGPRDPRTKTLRPLGKRSNPLNIQRENRWQRGKSTEYSLKRLRLRDLIKGKTNLVTICQCLCSFLLVSDRVAVYRNISFLLWSALQAESSKKHSLRIQEGHFLKMALNPVLILPDYRSRRELSGSVPLFYRHSIFDRFMAETLQK